MSPTRKARFKRRYVGVRPWKRHSLVLMVAGLCYIAIGASYIWTEATPSRNVALKLSLSWFPIQFWGCVFIIAGLMAVISSRWPPVAETWGYMVLTGLSAGWGGTYALGVIFLHSPPQNLSGAILWGLLGFMWWGISGLLNPEKEAMSTHGRSAGS